MSKRTTTAQTSYPGTRQVSTGTDGVTRTTQTDPAVVVTAAETVQIDPAPVEISMAAPVMNHFLAMQQAMEDNTNLIAASARPSDAQVWVEMFCACVQAALVSVNSAVSKADQALAAYQERFPE